MDASGAARLIPYPWCSIIFGTCFVLVVLIGFWRDDVQETEKMVPLDLMIAQFALIIIMGLSLVSVLINRPGTLFPTIFIGLAVGALAAGLIKLAKYLRRRQSNTKNRA